MLDTHRAHARTRSRRLVAIAFLVSVLGLHVVLATHFLDFSLVLERAPLGADDFHTHFAQTLRVIEGLKGWGKTWVYDVKLLAGQPEGTIFDADNKGWSLFTYALTRVGVSRAVGFNLFIALVMSSVPLVMLGAARLFGYGLLASTCTALLGTALWFFDSFTHWAWWIGMVSYAFAAYLALLPLGLFYRFVQSRRLGYALCCAPLLGLQHLIHPYSFFILAPPMAVMYARAFRSMTARDHAAVASIAVVTLAINANWLLVAFGHWHYILDSAYFGQTKLWGVLNDYVGLLRDPTDTGVIGTRTGFRFLSLGLGACGLWRLRSTGDARFLPLAVAIGCLFVLGYFGSYVPGGAQVQPYRHVIPLGFMAALPAGDFLARCIDGEVLRGASRMVLALLAVVALTATQHLVSDALYFFPTKMPKMPKTIDGVNTPLSAYGYPYLFAPDIALFDYRIPRARIFDEPQDRAESWLAARATPGDRILIDSPLVGERFAWRSAFEVMGGFTHRNLAHSHANLFRESRDKNWKARELAQYLRTFAISWVVTFAPREDFAAATDVLEHEVEILGVDIYRTKFAISKVTNGPGVVRARTNRIEVSDSDPNRDLDLSYHYHEALRCRPGCKVVRRAAAHDTVGLIRVPAPHAADIVIWNSYQ